MGFEPVLNACHTSSYLLKDIVSYELQESSQRCYIRMILKLSSLSEPEGTRINYI